MEYLLKDVPLLGLSFWKLADYPGRLALDQQTLHFHHIHLGLVYGPAVDTFWSNEHARAVPDSHPHVAGTLGPFFTIVPTTVAVRGSYMLELFTEFRANPMWPWLFGAILLISGLVIIAFHQYWRSPAAISCRS